MENNVFRQETLLEDLAKLEEPSRTLAGILVGISIDKGFIFFEERKFYFYKYQIEEVFGSVKGFKKAVTELEEMAILVPQQIDRRGDVINRGKAYMKIIKSYEAQEDLEKSEYSFTIYNNGQYFKDFNQEVIKKLSYATYFKEARPITDIDLYPKVKKRLELAIEECKIARHGKDVWGANFKLEGEIREMMKNTNIWQIERVKNANFFSRARWGDVELIDEDARILFKYDKLGELTGINEGYKKAKDKHRKEEMEGKGRENVSD